MSGRRDPGSGSLRERRPGVWELRVFVGSDPETGRPRQITKTVRAKTKREAREQLNDFRSKVRADVPSDKAHYTVRYLLEEWYSQRSVSGWAPTTAYAARRVIDNYLVPELGDVRLKDLDARRIDLLYRKLLAGSDGRSPQSAATVRRLHAVLSAALNRAVKWEWIRRNPARSADPPEAHLKPLRIPTPEEVRALMESAEALDPRFGILVALAVATGARRGELCALRWVDLEGDMIHFRRSLYRAGVASGEKGLKHGTEKVVPLGAAMTSLLAAWRAECEARAAAADVQIVPDAYMVSPMPTGSTPTNPDDFSRAVRTLCNELGLPHVHVHSLRHFAVTEMLAAGHDARNVAEIVGHANATMTLTVYAHATAERQRAATAVLDRVLMPAESAS